MKNGMTFVKMDSKESELPAIRQYALLKSYVRDRNRSEKLNEFKIHEQVPTASSSQKSGGNDKNVRQKTDDVSNNNGVLGGSISTSTSSNKYTVTDAASVPPLSKRKKVKNSKTSASQQNVLSSIKTPRRMKQDTKSSKSQKVVENSNNVKKHYLYTTLKPKFLRKNTFSRILKTGGGGIIEFLPSDVKSLRKQLMYLVGEYRAGNRSLKNQIAAILKNLHNRKVMNKREYGMEINSIFR